MRRDLYIYESPEWPRFTWRDEVIAPLLGEVRMLQGSVLGTLRAVGFSSLEESALQVMTTHVVQSSAIEGEALNREQVRSSIVRRLGLKGFEAIESFPKVDGAVEVMLDAVRRYHLPLSEERLIGWHAALFPTGHSGIYQVETGRYRSDEMEVISGGLGHERVHFRAPPPEKVPQEMDRFLEWFNNDRSTDPVLKAAVAHLWFVVVHPFDDGNGRIARALTDLLLARAEESEHRFYSLTNRIMLRRKGYYSVLQQMNHSAGEITPWLEWFLLTLKEALVDAEELIRAVLMKARFWQRHLDTPLNGRQRIAIHKLLDRFEGKLTSSKWAKLTKCSQDTALRDIKELIALNILAPADEGGRSTHYTLRSY